MQPNSCALEHVPRDECRDREQQRDLELVAEHRHAVTRVSIVGAAHVMRSMGSVCAVRIVPAVVGTATRGVSRTENELRIARLIARVVLVLIVHELSLCPLQSNLTLRLILAAGNMCSGICVKSLTRRCTSPTRVIPYFTIPPLHLGPIDVQSFGVLSALGVWFASWLLVRGARVRGLDERPVLGVATWALVGGVVGAHLMHVLLYHPEELRGSWNAWQLLKFWDGLSSTGGVLGGTAAVLLYFRRRGLPFSRYSDVFALAIAPGWAVARLGCFSVHDHPGRLTSFPLAVAFPEGARHDLGLDDALLLAVIAAILYACARRALLSGRLLPLLALLYGIGRFFLDFLRATDLPYVDARYFGLTPAQYVCIGFVVYGVLGLRRSPVAGKSGAGAGEPQRQLEAIRP